MTFSGSPVTPTVTIVGSGFGDSPQPDPPYVPAGHGTCPIQPGNPGLDYGERLYIVDTTANWSAGRYRQPSNGPDCTGLVVTTFTPTRVVFQLGTAYASGPARAHPLKSGDTFMVEVEGQTFRGKVTY